MPIEIRCSRCRHLIYLGCNVDGLEEIFRLINDLKCTNCGKKIIFEPDKLKIRIESAFSWKRLKKPDLKHNSNENLV